MKKTLAISLFLISPSIWAADFEVHKSPTCGCCQKWVDALKVEGHQVTIHHTDDLHAIKKEAGLPVELGACHTAFVDGYVIEGHVPIQAINELLESKPEIKGIAVPGMPAESLGMEYGNPPATYSVFSFDTNGNIKPIAEYEGTTRKE